MASTAGPVSGPTRVGNQEVIRTDDRAEQQGSTLLEQAVAGGYVLSELERLLHTPGCPACKYVEEAERSFFTWLRIESFSVPEVQARLRASMGMCAAHSRRLVEEVGEGHVMTIVMRDAVAGARQRVRDELAPGPCPACQAVASGAQRARRMVLDGLNDPAEADLYARHGGICLPHFLLAAPLLDRSMLKLLAERLIRSLSDTADAGRLAMLAGADHDACRRGHWRDRLPAAPPAGTTLEQLCERLGLEACPVCLATGLGERRFLRWYLERAAENDPSLRNDPGELCFPHLHDLARAGPSLAAQAIEHKRASRVGKLERLLARLDETPEPMRRGRRVAVDEGLEAARHELATAPYCPACNARDGVEQSQLELIGAALALATVRERYERGHGLCVRHAMQVPDGQSRIARRCIDGRLGVLAWEVGETARKYAWAFRHEPSGAEQQAWLRALAQIDGSVFGGGPAPAEVPGAGSGQA